MPQPSSRMEDGGQGAEDACKLFWWSESLWVSVSHAGPVMRQVARDPLMPRHVDSEDEHMAEEMRSHNAVDRLRFHTVSHHQRAEAVPFMQSLLRGLLDREDYIRYLRSLSIVYAVLEHSLATSTEPAVGSVWREGMRQLPHLMQDLDALTAWRVPDSRPATEEALALADRIRLQAVEAPASLLGFLYVMEGSRNGASLIVDTIGSYLGIDAQGGMAFLSNAATDRDVQWADFSSRMNRCLASDKHQAICIAAAQEMFDHMIRIFEGLMPLQPTELAWLATTLNPEAGRHPVPNDLRDIEAVIRASRRCWEAFPYYAWRYAGRGIRFADSDCAWLASLTTLAVDDVLAQVRWLATVLSSRGMPTLLLETQLRMLNEELMIARPDRRQYHQRLVAAAEALARARAAQLPVSAATALADAFDTAVATKCDPTFPAMGEILVSAVCDEANGMDQVVSSIRDWVDRSGAIGSGWLNAIEHMIEAAHNAISAHQSRAR